MTSTITDGVTTISPQLVLGYQSSRNVGTIVHEVPLAEEPAITLGPASTRAGTLTCLFLDAASAVDLETLLSESDMFSFADSDVPTADMDFVVTGTIACELDEDTRALWTVAFGFREV